MKINKKQINRLFKDNNQEEIDQVIIYLNELKEKKNKEYLFIEEIKTKAQELGFDINELIGNEKKKVKDKYSMINENGQTLYWSGKGRKPKWILEYIESNGKLEDIEVN